MGWHGPWQARDDDARVASLLLWHFCEEIEHRSSGVAVYDAVVGKYFYRVGNFRNFMAHVKKVTDMLRAEFIKHVPGVTAEMFKGSPNSALPRMAKLKAAMCMLAAQMPWHNSDRQALPAYYHEWTDRFDRGEDMRQVYGARWEEAELAAVE